MKRSIADYTLGSVLCVGLLLTATPARAQDAPVQRNPSPPQQTQSPGFEPGPGPTGSRPDVTGTPGSMSSQSGKTPKQHLSLIHI